MAESAKELFGVSVLTRWDAHERPVRNRNRRKSPPRRQFEDGSRRSIDYELVLHRPVGSIPSGLRQS